MHRYVFHIPCAVYENGALKPAPWQQVIDDFAEVLYKHTDGFFVQDAVGYLRDAVMRKSCWWPIPLPI